MTLWARLTWQAKEPEARAAELARRLLVPAEPGGLVPDAWLLHLGTALLEVRPWVREGPADRPRSAGRLVLEPVPGGEDPPAERPWAHGPGVALLGLGWATVELDRAEAELSTWTGPRTGEDGLDMILGARTRRLAGAGLPGAWTVLLEPSTEGRAAASLALDGEGPCALYLAVPGGLDAWLAASPDGSTAPRRRTGPFGDQVRLPAGPAGPHLLVTDGRIPLWPDPVPGTIAP